MQLVIDGKTVHAREGSTVLEAAQQAGIYIPSLCFHPHISAIGSCRLCVVEVEGVRGLPCSCTLPAMTGMVVHTNTPWVQEFRSAMLQNILRIHPPSCLICPANLQCKLQETVAYIGAGTMGPLTTVRDPALRQEHIFFDWDHNLCVRCGLCVRACQEVRGNKVIYMLSDAQGLSVGPPLGLSLQDAGCQFCGACVDVCPTGALMGRSEAGIPERTVTTICPHCGVGCQMKIEVRHGRVSAAIPDTAGPANGGQACVKGRFGIPEFVHHKDRVTKPLVRKNGELVEVEWEEALDVVANSLARYSGDQIAVVASAEGTNEDCYVVQKMARTVLGTNNIANSAGATAMGLAKSFGVAAMTGPISDIKDAACILAVGADIAETYPVIALEVQKAVRKGGKLIVINPRRSSLAKQTDTWLRPLPGSEAALLMGMARVIVDEGLEDTAFIADRCEDYEAFRVSLEGFSLDTVAQVTGVPGESIARSARIFATHKPASILYTQDSHGADSVLAMANLAMLTGNVGRPASGMYPLCSRGNIQGCCDMGALPDMLPGYQGVAEAQARSRFEAAWGCRLKAGPGLTLTEMFDAVHEGRIKAMYLVGESSVLGESNARGVMSAVERLEFLVVQDMFLTETARQANVVLPACSFAEKEGTFTNAERRVQRVRKAIGELGGSRPDWWITCQIARRMGGRGFDFEGPSQIMDEIAKVTPVYGGISYQRLEAGSLMWPCPSQGHPGTSRLHVEGFALGKGRFTPLTYKDSRESPSDEYPLMLTAGLAPRRSHMDGLIRRVKGPAAPAWTGIVELNPEDAKGLQVAEGDRVRLVSRRGQLVATARVTGATPPRVACMIFDHVESPLVEATDAASGVVGGILRGKVCAVRVEKAVEAPDV